ncbi:MAG: LysM peptidoglycan-binding domain-containing protein [Lentisphaerota bacterium]
MKTNHLIIALGLISLLFAGCAPELARTNYGPEEQQWKNYIQKSYNGWQAPPTPAPYSENNVSQGASSTIEGVPAAASMTEATPLEIAIASPAKGVLSTETSYTVKKGDTLWSISKNVYGDGNSWKKIQEANKAILGDSNSLKAGTVLQIPVK